MIWIRKRLFLLLVAVNLAVIPGSSDAARFDLLSRSLLEGPARKVVDIEGGSIIVSGGALALIPQGNSPLEYTLFPLEGEPYDIVVSGSIAYVASWNRGLLTIDLSDFSKPQVRRSYNSRKAMHCALCPGRLFFYDSSRGLADFDLSDPLEPVLINTIDIERNVISLLSGENSIAVIYSDGVRIFHIDAGDTLAGSGKISTAPLTGRGAFSGGILYLVARDGTILRYMSAQGTPARKIVPFPAGDASDIIVSGGEGLVLLKNGRIEPFRITGGKIERGRSFTADYSKAGAAPPEVRLSLTGRLMGEKRSGSFPGNTLFLTSSGPVTSDPRTGFWFYSGSEGDLSFLAHIPTKGFAIDLVAGGGYLFLANGNDGLRTGKIGPDGSVEWRGHLQTSIARDVALDGDLLLLADGSDGLRTIDVSDPDIPQELGHLPSPFFLSSIWVDDGMVYLAGGLGGTEVVDISDPGRPKLVWREKFSEVRGIFAEGDYFYFSDGFAGFKIYSIATGKPVEITAMDRPGWNCDLFVDGDILYLAEGGNGVCAADISDRAAPKILGSVEIGSIAREIHFMGKTLFVASHKKGITAVDMSDPKTPFIAARFPTVDDARGVFADDRFVYLASGEGGVYIFRYSD